MVVTVGLASGPGQLVQLRPSAGCQVNVEPPLAFMVVLLPIQMLASAAWVPREVATATLTVAVTSLQPTVIPVMVYVVKLAVGLEVTVAPVV